VRRPRHRVIIVSLVLSALAFWFFVGSPSDSSDDGRYADWCRANRALGRVAWYQQWLPQFFVSVFHLPEIERKHAEKSQTLEQALTRSGYLTNLAVTATNNGLTLPPSFDRLWRVVPRGGVVVHRRSSSEVVVICRLQDANACQTVLTGKTK